MADCIFCKIIKGEIPSKVEKETANLIVIHDTNPKAPIHLLIISKKHVQDIREDDGVIWAAAGKLAVELAKEKKLTGFRLVHNVGEVAMIPHMHVQFLGDISKDREV